MEINPLHRALYCATTKKKLVNDLLETTNASVTEEKPMKKKSSKQVLKGRTNAWGIWEN
jgi:hypothetical protein